MMIYPIGSDEPVYVSSLDEARDMYGDDFLTAEDCEANGDEVAADRLRAAET